MDRGLCLLQRLMALVVVFLPVNSALANGSVLCEDIVASPSTYYGTTTHVVCTYAAAKRTSKAIFLNSNSDWKNGFSVVLWKTYWSQFPDSPETEYVGKEMVIEGAVQQHFARPNNTERPQILLKDPAQIIFIDADP